MIDLVKLPATKECCDYIRDELLQTEILRASYDEGGFIRKWIVRFARRPRFFYKPSQEFVSVVDSEGKEHREFIEAPISLLGGEGYSYEPTTTSWYRICTTCMRSATQRPCRMVLIHRTHSTIPSL